MSETTIRSNKVVGFRICDMIGSTRRSRNEDSNSDPKVHVSHKRFDKKSRQLKTIRNKKEFEISSFKMSNRLSIHGNKPKKNRTPVHQNTTDILWMHNEKLKYFRELQEVVLPKKRKQLEECIDDRDKLNLQREIYRIESREEEIHYTLLTQDVIENYKKMSENDDETTMRKDTSGRITKYINKYDNVEKERITEEYCRLLNNGMMINSRALKFDNSKCKQCGGDTEFYEGFNSCKKCGLASEKSIHDFRVSYNDFQDTVVKSTFSYKRHNRFQEILATLQAKENTELPEFVMNAVQSEIDKEPNLDLNALDKTKIKYYLKRLSLNNYYEHAPHILNKLNGIPPITIPHEVEEKLREMFRDIQEPFDIVKEKVCPNRLSFLSYNFVLYKFCELLDLDEYKKCFSLLKSIDKLRTQDKIWKGICEILGWEYIPSV
jgi:hypothetical protein